MQVRHRWAPVILLAAGLALSACAKASEGEEARKEPATLEVVSNDPPISRVTLEPKAIERLGIEVAPVEEVPVPGGFPQKAIPYAAVIYAPDGATWAYTNLEPRAYVRAAITVERIEQDRAFLTAGPPTGTAVVTVGGAELYGAENEIGD